MIWTYDVNFDEKVKRAASKLKQEFGENTNLNDTNTCMEISRLVLMVGIRVDAEKDV